MLWDDYVVMMVGVVIAGLAISLAVGLVSRIDEY